MGVWKHPTGKIPETVVLVAMGPSKQQWIDERVCLNPKVNPDELWTLNAGCDWLGNYDLLFYMDDLREQCNHYPGTHEKLKRVTKPIITTVVYKDLNIKAPLYAYPLEMVLNHVGPANDYFINSVPYIIAYALTIGVKRLIMFGVDYEYPGIQARESGRPCCEFWCGFANAKGMIVQVCDRSTVLNAYQGRPFYGYLRQPIILQKPDEDPQKPENVVEMDGKQRSAN